MVARVLLLLLAWSAAAAPARAQECGPVRMADGRHVLLATWPDTATRVCFFRPGVVGSEVCATEPKALTPGDPPTLQVGGELLQVRAGTCGSSVPLATLPVSVAYAVVRLDAGVLWKWQAFAENAAGRSDTSAATFVADLRPPVVKPSAPQLLGEIRAQARAIAERAAALERKAGELEATLGPAGEP